MLYYIFGREIAHYLWYYVLTPGNLLTGLFALFTPYIVRYNILPYIYHPYRYGGIPFVAPSFFEYQGMYYILIIAIVSCFYFISGYMATLKICNKSDYKTVLFNYRKLLVCLIGCMLLLIIFPLIKIPLLTALMILPYSNEIVNGVFWALAAFLGTAWANRETIFTVCGK